MYIHFLLGVSAKHFNADVSTTVSQNRTTGSATLRSISAYSRRRSCKTQSRYNSPVPRIMCSPDSSTYDYNEEIDIIRINKIKKGPDIHWLRHTRFIASHSRSKDHRCRREPQRSEDVRVLVPSVLRDCRRLDNGGIHAAQKDPAASWDAVNLHPVSRLKHPYAFHLLNRHVFLVLDRIALAQHAHHLPSLHRTAHHAAKGVKPGRVLGAVEFGDVNHQRAVGVAVTHRFRNGSVLRAGVNVLHLKIEKFFCDVDANTNTVHRMRYYISKCPIVPWRRHLPPATAHAAQPYQQTRSAVQKTARARV
ncbi:hypothetical protein BC937DRAFT_88699 [Endogone sp. FLAS-F59071]|nr:hypothetical protein BC937DRAFT_88699 [Endogone sp. FLAS-F59071]|eukprot:RUS18499.1 hypothetical protein BC937DRAFT_88699 [Endogone sp. FLAS-F59071]